MKKFVIKKLPPDNWIVTHNEFPRFTCLFENKKFLLQRTFDGLVDPMGDPKEVKQLQRMDDWLMKYHKDKISS